MSKNITPILVDYLEVKQPIGPFYICSMSWEDLSDIAYADIRRLTEEDDLGRHIGIQRRISPSRIKEISAYVRTCDATFPTGVIIAIDKYYAPDGTGCKALDYDRLENNEEYKENVEFLEVEGVKKLSIRRADGVALILDGQHRLVGLRKAFDQLQLQDIEKLDFELNVTIFIDINMDDKAQIFSIINKSQTKVNKSLVYDLYEYSKTDCPQKTAHDIVRLLDQRKDSPFYEKVKILGPSEDFKETISQATLAELIIGYISKDPMKDRDEIKKDKSKRRSRISRDFQKHRFIFRQYFIDDHDEFIYLIVSRYFTAVKKRWESAWMDSTKILSKSTGVIALMRLLRDVYNLHPDPENPISYYKEVFDKSNLRDEDFNKDDFVPGSSGQTKLYNELKKECLK